VVVLVSQERADSATVAALELDGLIVQVLAPKGSELPVAVSQSAGDAAVKAHLWSLTQYDRVVYVGPRAMVTKSTDALFACEGFCAGMQQQRSAASSKTQTRRSVQTDVMVLEPSAETHSSLLQALETLTPAAARAIDAGVFLAGALALDAECPVFEDLDDFAPAAADSSSSGADGTDGAASVQSSGGSAAAGAAAAAAGAGRGPIFVLNAEHMPLCSPGAVRSAPGSCKRLPYRYAAPSEDLHRRGGWQGAVGDPLGRTDASAAAAAEPHIVRFAAPGDRPWLGVTRHPALQLFWQWQAFREQLREPYSSSSSSSGWLGALLALLLPSALLAAALAHYKLYIDCSSKRKHSGSDSAANAAAAAAATAGVSPPRLRRAAPLQRCSDVLPTVATPDAAHRGSYLLHGAQAQPLAVRVALCCAAAAFGKLWLAAAGVCSSLHIDPEWHPAAGAAVRSAWLACALIAGLHLLDFAYYAVVTWGRTLRRDAPLCAALLAALGLLCAHDAWTGGADVSGGGWPRVLCAGTLSAALLLGAVHARRARSAALRLSSGRHLTAVAAVCTAAAAGAGAVALAAPPALLRAQLHSALGSAQLLVSCCVYSSLFVSSVSSSSSSSNSNNSSAEKRAETGWQALAQRAVHVLAAAVELLNGARLRQPRLLKCSSTSSTSSTSSSSSSCSSSSSRSSAKHRSRRSSSSTALAAAVARLLRDQWHWCIAAGALVYVVAPHTHVARAVRTAAAPPQVQPLHYRVHSEQCLYGEWGYASAGGSRLAGTCGAAETFKPIITASGAVCLRTADGCFLTPRRGKLLDDCTGESQFVFQPARSSPAMGDLSGGAGGLLQNDTAGPGGGKLTAAERERLRLQQEGFCAYNAATGLYLSASSHPQQLCRLTERWRVQSWSW
jgi:hypothetical protein